MKPRNAVLSHSDVLAKWLIRAVWVMFLACWGQAVAAPQGEGVIEISQAEFIYSDVASSTLETAEWQPVALPHRSPKPTDRDLVGYLYRASFTLPDPNRPLWLYFPKLRSGGDIFINGTHLEDIRDANSSHQVRWFRPYLFFLPPAILKAGHNEIAVRFVIREPLTSFGEFYVGPERPLREAFESNMFWETTTTRFASMLCVFAGIFILTFWWRRRQESLYGIFGLAVLLWGLRTFIFRMPEVAMEYWVLWRFCYYFGTAGFITLITIFLLEFSGMRRPNLNRFLVVYWLAGCLLFLLVGVPLRRFMDLYWMGSFLPFTVYAVIRLTLFAARQRTPSGMAMVLVIAFALVLALHDFAVQHGMFGLQEFYLLHLATPAFLLVMGGVLLDRFVDSLKEAESANEQLSLRVAERESELAASYQKVRQLERDHAATEERQRIMQDMHDGVGSQLLSALVMVQRGAATQNDMVALLQECLDDMRLAIDSLSPTDPDLLPVLGNFRFRMASRFKGMGLELCWRNHDMPDALEIAPHAGLQVLRILQEGLTNVLKHAQATKVDVDLYFAPQSLRVRIGDNGVGFADRGNPDGRGLANMQMRAKKIGAAFRIEPLAAGTAVCLDLPLGHAASAQHA
jgi:signal transduction histidine kinase